MNKLKFILLFAFALSAIAQLAAQPMRNNLPEDIIAAADEQFAKKNWSDAADWYLKYYDLDKTDRETAYKIAQCYLQLRDYTKAETWLSRAVSKTTSRKKAGKTIDNDAMTEAKFQYARVLKMNEKYDEAITAFDDYISLAKEGDKFLSLAKAEWQGAKIASSMKENAKLEIKNAGKNVNSAQGEYSPAQGKDGTLYFASHRSDEIITLDGKEGDYHTKIYTSTRNAKGNWEEAKALGDEINRPNVDQGNVCLSADGNVLYFTRVELSGNTIGTSKIYYCVKSGGNWGPSTEVAGLTGTIAKHPAMGELYGKEVLFFVSDMEGTKGGFDIFYATKIDNGSFTAPVNLGEVINTAGDDESPFYRDGKLYFASTGHAGLGGLDVFVSEWNGSTWSNPKNLGKGVNSSVDDHYYSTDAQGDGYVVSNRAGGKSVKSKTCCDDIWVITKEKVILQLEGIATDGKATLNGVSYELAEITNGKAGKTDTKMGDMYASNLEVNRSYRLAAKKEGYESNSVEFNTVGLDKSELIKKSIALKLIPKVIPPPTPPPTPPVVIKTVTRKDKISLPNIYYKLNKAKANGAEMENFDAAQSSLDYLYSLMVKYSDLVIEVGSHTDSRGTAESNIKLSQRRADGIREYLMAKGISSERIVPKGYGETVLVNQCKDGVKCSEEEHLQNRRTEFQIISGPTEIEVEVRN